MELGCENECADSATQQIDMQALLSKTVGIIAAGPFHIEINGVIAVVAISII